MKLLNTAKKITTAAALAAALLAGTVPAVGVPASRLALAVLHPGQFCRLPEGSDSPPNGSEKQV